MHRLQMQRIVAKVYRGDPPFATSPRRRWFCDPTISKQRFEIRISRNAWWRASTRRKFCHSINAGQMNAATLFACCTPSRQMRFSRFISSAPAFSSGKYSRENIAARLNCGGTNLFMAMMPRLKWLPYPVEIVTLRVVAYE